MPGAGKSTFGRQLADVLKYDFADLDDVIEARTGKRIPELFKVSEEYFREEETAALQEVMAGEKPLIIASGGGTPCFNDNMNVIRKHAISVFLDPPMTILIHRTEQESHRPLLQGKDVTQRLAELYAERESYYQQAHIRLKEATPSAQKVIDLIDSIRN